MHISTHGHSMPTAVGPNILTVSKESFELSASKSSIERVMKEKGGGLSIQIVQDIEGGRYGMMVISARSEGLI